MYPGGNNDPTAGGRSNNPHHMSQQPSHNSFLSSTQQLLSGLNPSDTAAFAALFGNANSSPSDMTSFMMDPAVALMFNASLNAVSSAVNQSSVNSSYMTQAGGLPSIQPSQQPHHSNVGQSRSFSHIPTPPMPTQQPAMRSQPTHHHQPHQQTSAMLHGHEYYHNNQPRKKSGVGGHHPGAQISPGTQNVITRNNNAFMQPSQPPPTMQHQYAHQNHGFQQQPQPMPQRQQHHPSSSHRRLSAGPDSQAIRQQQFHQRRHNSTVVHSSSPAIPPPPLAPATIRQSSSPRKSMVPVKRPYDSSQTSKPVVNSNNAPRPPPMVSNSFDTQPSRQMIAPRSSSVIHANPAHDPASDINVVRWIFATPCSKVVGPRAKARTPLLAPTSSIDVSIGNTNSNVEPHRSNSEQHCGSVNTFDEDDTPPSASILMTRPDFLRLRNFPWHIYCEQYMMQQHLRSIGAFDGLLLKEDSDVTSSPVAVDKNNGSNVDISDVPSLEAVPPQSTVSQNSTPLIEPSFTPSMAFLHVEQSLRPLLRRGAVLALTNTCQGTFWPVTLVSCHGHMLRLRCFLSHTTLLLPFFSPKLQFPSKQLQVLLDEEGNLKPRPVVPSPPVAPSAPGGNSTSSSPKKSGSASSTSSNTTLPTATTKPAAKVYQLLPPPDTDILVEGMRAYCLKQIRHVRLTTNDESGSVVKKESFSPVKEEVVKQDDKSASSDEKKPVAPFMSPVTKRRFVAAPVATRAQARKAGYVIPDAKSPRPNRSGSLRDYMVSDKQRKQLELENQLQIAEEDKKFLGPDGWMWGDRDDTFLSDEDLISARYAYETIVKEITKTVDNNHPQQKAMFEYVRKYGCLYPYECIVVGSLLELQDETNTSYYWFVKVIQNKRGRLTLEYIKSASLQTFPCQIQMFYSSRRLRYLSFAAGRQNVMYQCPVVGLSKRLIPNIVTACLAHKSAQPPLPASLFALNNRGGPSPVHGLAAGNYIEMLHPVTKTHVEVVRVNQVVSPSVVIVTPFSNRTTDSGNLGWMSRSRRAGDMDIFPLGHALSKGMPFRIPDFVDLEEIVTMESISRYINADSKLRLAVDRVHSHLSKTQNCLSPTDAVNFKRLLYLNITRRHRVGNFPHLGLTFPDPSLMESLAEQPSTNTAFTQMTGVQSDLIRAGQFLEMVHPQMSQWIVPIRVKSLKTTLLEVELLPCIDTNESLASWFVPLDSLDLLPVGFANDANIATVFAGSQLCLELITASRELLPAHTASGLSPKKNRDDDGEKGIPVPGRPRGRPPLVPKRVVPLTVDAEVKEEATSVPKLLSPTESVSIYLNTSCKRGRMLRKKSKSGDQPSGQGGSSSAAAFAGIEACLNAVAHGDGAHGSPDHGPEAPISRSVCGNFIEKIGPGRPQSIFKRLFEHLLDLSWKATRTAFTLSARSKLNMKTLLAPKEATTFSPALTQADFMRVRVGLGGAYRVWVPTRVDLASSFCSKISEWLVMCPNYMTTRKLPGPCPFRCDKLLGRQDFSMLSRGEGLSVSDKGMGSSNEDLSEEDDDDGDAKESKVSSMLGHPSPSISPSLANGDAEDDAACTSTVPPATMSELVGKLELSNTEDPTAWTVDDVTFFLKYHGCDEKVWETLAREEIDGSAFLILNLAVIQSRLCFDTEAALRLCTLIEQLHMARALPSVYHESRPPRGKSAHAAVRGKRKGIHRVARETNGAASTVTTSTTNPNNNHSVVAMETDENGQQQAPSQGASGTGLKPPKVKSFKRPPGRPPRRPLVQREISVSDTLDGLLGAVKVEENDDVSRLPSVDTAASMLPTPPIENGEEEEDDEDEKPSPRTVIPTSKFAPKKSNLPPVRRRKRRWADAGKKPGSSSSGSTSSKKNIQSNNYKRKRRTGVTSVTESVKMEEESGNDNDDDDDDEYEDEPTEKPADAAKTVTRSKRTRGLAPDVPSTNGASSSGPPVATTGGGSIATGRSVRQRIATKRYIM